MTFQRILQCIFYKTFRRLIPTNIDINERLWTGRFGANGTSLRFIYRYRFLIFKNNSEVANLLNVFRHKVFSFSFVMDEKKTTVMKSLSIYFGHLSLS